MSTVRFKKIIMRKMMHFLAIFMSIMMIVGSIPANAAKKKTVTVKSLKSLISAMEDSKVGTIKFKSSKSLTITIPEIANSQNKKLYISASKARITNNSLFKSISIRNIKEFREEAEGNSITVKSNNATIVIGKDSRVKKLTFASTSANAIFEKRAEVISLICKKTSASVNVDFGKNTKAAITLSKKTVLTLTGDKSADISVVSKAKGSSVNASVPADIKADKNTSVTLEKGSEGSSVDSASKSVKVKIMNNSDKNPVIKVAGEEVPSATPTPTPTPKPTAAPTPKPTATPTPKPASGSDTGSGSTGGGSTGGSTGGGSTGGYTGGGSTGGYTGGGSTSGYTGGGSTGGYTGGGSTGGYTGGGSTGGYTGGGSTDGYTGGGSTGGYTGDGSTEDNTGDGSTEDNTGEGSTASQDTVPEGIYLSSNSSFNDYRTWSNPVFSYLYKEDGYFWRVEVGEKSQYRNYENGGKVYVEKYDESLKLVDHSVINFGNLYWGGFYHGQKYNFIIVGDRNKEEDDNKTVIRIIKYDKQWNQLGNVDLKGAYTTDPFEAGSLRCAEANGYLFVTTSHVRYTTSDGLNHQSNMSFSIDEENMTMPYAGYVFQPGYVSHSFNQYILVNENGQIVTADHGDAYPRSMQVAILEVENGVIKSDDEHRLISFKGNIGDNATGATLGGIEETSGGYVIAFNDNRRGSVDAGAAKSIYVAFVAKGVTDNPTERSGVRIVYDADGTIRTTTPVMVSTGINNGGYIFWEEYNKDKDPSYDADKKVCYLQYDALGSVSDIYSFSGSLSDCKPIYDNGTICWYVTGKIDNSKWGYDDGLDTAPCFYFLNTGNGQVSRQYPGASVQLLELVPTVKEKEYYINAGDSGDILFKKDIRDASGKLQTTEYYDEENQLVSKAVYSYNEAGALTGKSYYVISDGNTAPETEYCYYPESRKIKTISRGKTNSYDDGRTVCDYYNEYYENGGAKVSKSKVVEYDENGDVISCIIEETEWYENGIVSEKFNSYSNNFSESSSRTTYSENGVKKQTTNKDLYTGSYTSFSLTEKYFNEEEKLIKSVTETNESVITSLYDDNERILEKAYSDKTEKNENGYVIKYTYNDDGSYMAETLFPNNTYGKKVVIYSAEGSVLRAEEYFKSGRLNIICEYGRSGNPNTLVYSEERRDDEQNSLIYKTESVTGESGTLTEKKETKYDFYGNNTVTSTIVTRYNAEGLRYSKTETLYYANGRIMRITEADIVYSESNGSVSERLKRNAEYYDNESNSCRSVRENEEVNGRNQETTIQYSEDGYKLKERVSVDDEYSYGYYNYVDPKNGYIIYYSENEKPYSKSEYDENRDEIRRTTYVNGIDYEIFELQNGVWVKAANGSYTDPTSEEIYNRITALKNNEYPEGMAWTNDNKYEWGSIVTSSLGISRYTGNGCQAFAMIASDAAFGNAPVYRYDNDGTATVRVGDILRLNNDTHSVIVLAIDGDTLTIAEGNYNGTIHWGRTISLSGCGFTYGYTRYRPN